MFVRDINLPSLNTRDILRNPKRVSAGANIEIKLEPSIEPTSRKNLELVVY